MKRGRGIIMIDEYLQTTTENKENNLAKRKYINY